jgi:D-alanyl-D-alanine carboxypeptidase/D-alanyl-D-alanine-endopeptidase (penicillin-binding protein 4)
VLRRRLFRTPSSGRRVAAAAAVLLVAGAVTGAVVASGPGSGQQPALAHASAPVAGGPPLSPAGAGLPAAGVAAAPRTVATTVPPPLGPVLDAALVNADACLVVHDAQGRVLYSHQPSLPLAPASTQKLLIAAAALDLLGPSYRFTTTVVTDRPLVQGVADLVWLVGGGDPVLSSPEFTTFLTAQPEFARQPVTTPLSWLADHLRAAGVRAVFGGVRGDDSRYDRTRFLPAWKPSYIKGAETAPLGALEVDDGLDRWRPVPALTADPAAHAAGVLARLLQAGGVAAPPGPDGTAPANAIVLARVVSPPLSDIVTSMLRVSDNTAAEMLVRELDRASGGAGTTAGGLAVVARDAGALGIPVGGLHLDDGSGLAPTDRATCTTLLAALDLGLQPRFAPLARLSVSGQYGTLIDRFLGTPAQGQLSGKTGSLDGVAGLVARWGNVEFAFLLNGTFPYATGVAYENRVVAALTAYAGT